MFACILSAAVVLHMWLLNTFWRRQEAFLFWPNPLTMFTLYMIEFPLSHNLFLELSD